jgi:hypothetical protein
MPFVFVWDVHFLPFLEIRELSSGSCVLLGKKVDTPKSNNHEI